MRVRKFAALCGAVLFVTGFGAGRAAASPFAYVVTENSKFGTVDLSNGTFSQIGTVPAGVAGLAGDTVGNLYGYTSTATGASVNELLSINPSTGASSVNSDRKRRV